MASGGFGVTSGHEGSRGGVRRLLGRLLHWSMDPRVRHLLPVHFGDSVVPRAVSLLRLRATPLLGGRLSAAGARLLSPWWDPAVSSLLVRTACGARGSGHEFTWFKIRWVSSSASRGARKGGPSNLKRIGDKLCSSRCPRKGSRSQSVNGCHPRRSRWWACVS